MSFESFEREAKTLVDTNKLSTNSIKTVTDLAIASVSRDAHLVATLVRLHKRAHPSSKLSALYIIDAIARDFRARSKKGKQKAPTSSALDSEETESGTFAAFLHKMEQCLERVIEESVQRGKPEHKERVKKLLDIWIKSATFDTALLGKLIDSVSQSIDPSGSHTITTMPEINSTISPEILALMQQHQQPGEPPQPHPQTLQPHSAANDTNQEQIQSALSQLLTQASQFSQPSKNSAPPTSSQTNSNYSDVANILNQLASNKSNSTENIHSPTRSPTRQQQDNASQKYNNNRDGNYYNDNSKPGSWKDRSDVEQSSSSWRDRGGRGGRGGRSSGRGRGGPPGRRGGGGDDYDEFSASSRGGGSGGGGRKRFSQSPQPQSSTHPMSRWDQIQNRQQHQRQGGHENDTTFSSSSSPTTRWRDQERNGGSGSNEGDGRRSRRRSQSPPPRNSNAYGDEPTQAKPTAALTVDVSKDNEEAADNNINNNMEQQDDEQDDDEPFDVSKFDSYDPSSWLKFSKALRKAYGRVPTNEEMIAISMATMVGNSGSGGPPGGVFPGNSALSSGEPSPMMPPPNPMLAMGGMGGGNPMAMMMMMMNSNNNKLDMGGENQNPSQNEDNDTQDVKEDKNGEDDDMQQSE